MKKNSFCFLLTFMFSLTCLGTTPTQDLMSPLSTDASSFFWTGTLVTSFFLITEDNISDPATEDTSTTKPLGDASKLGDLYGQVYPNLIYFAGMGLHGLISNNKKSNALAAHMFKATLYAGLTVTALKYTVREPRPNSINEKNSFPSGHTTTAFTFATVVATHHEWYWGLLAFGGACLTGYSRMNDGRHFLHDVTAGMTLGISYGLGTYFTQFKGQGKRFAVAPIIDNDSRGLRLMAAW